MEGFEAQDSNIGIEASWRNGAGLRIREVPVFQQRQSLRTQKAHKHKHFMGISPILIFADVLFWGP